MMHRLNRCQQIYTKNVKYSMKVPVYLSFIQKMRIFFFISPVGKFGCLSFAKNLKRKPGLVPEIEAEDDFEFITYSETPF